MQQRRRMIMGRFPNRCVYTARDQEESLRYQDLDHARLFKIMIKTKAKTDSWKTNASTAQYCHYHAIYKYVN